MKKINVAPGTMYFTRYMMWLRVASFSGPQENTIILIGDRMWVEDTGPYWREAAAQTTAIIVDADGSARSDPSSVGANVSQCDTVSQDKVHKKVW